jgi:outer membrane receptor for ferrienterochelin and colicins
MIERVEVVRGGGSALYGSNAIAGTINIILKEPSISTFELGLNAGMTGVGTGTGSEPAGDYSASFNSSYISSDSKTGFAIFGFVRDRGIYDANNDDFSEIAPMSNTSAGAQFTHRFGNRSRFTADLFNIVEKRNGGNRQEYPLHERDLAEAVEHDIKTGALTFEQFLRKNDLLSFYGSAQYLNRDSYYGALRSLDSYGKSTDLTWNAGVQYKARFDGSSLIAGAEVTGGRLKDTKLGYPDIGNAIIDADTITYIPHTENTVITRQLSFTRAFFLQYEATLGKASFVFGGRYDNYIIRDLENDDNHKPGHVFSPRVSFRYKVTPFLNGRLSYSKGFRAPQIFDEDLHIETSGSRQVINANSPDLREETSHSFMASLDMNKLVGTVQTGLLIEGFYTRLNDPFVNDIGIPDSEGTVIYTRRNAEDGATVRGANIELKLKPLTHLEVSSGITIQSSAYDAAQEFDERRFFRSPSSYGFFAIDLDITDNLCITSTGSYTGKMLIPYFGPDTDPVSGELRSSDPFFDMGIKISYDIRLNGSTMQLITGMKNIFNSFQSDFDLGINRDPAYIYGPISPRMVYAGIRIGNQISDRHSTARRKGSSAKVEQRELSGPGKNASGGRKKHNRKGWR